MTTKNATMASCDAEGRCTHPYSFDDVRGIILQSRRAGKSLRYIAKHVFQNRITHGTVQRIAQGQEPQDPNIRAAIGLPVLNAVVEVVWGALAFRTQTPGSSFCRDCGQPFVSNHPRRKKCYTCSAPRKRIK